MQIRTIIVFSLIIIAFVSCSKNNYNKKQNLTIAFYNVENLFDLKDEAGKEDEEFTPSGTKKWTSERYKVKLDALAAVLSSINKNDLPEIIGLCEVENKLVVEDLVRSKHLRKGKYKVIHYESPDVRGIDCALIYRPQEFEVVHSCPIRVNIKDDANYTTRDILYVKGKTVNQEELHIFVNHWPSRAGGLAKTEPKRIEVATLVKSKIDSIQEQNLSAQIIVMGDMNDEPANKSLSETLRAGNPELGNKDFVNLMYPDHKAGKGSYNFRGNWNMLDNIVVSKNLLEKEGFYCADQKGFVFREEWMEYKNRDGQVSPDRTYGGPNYYGGISDHFPVYFRLKL